MPDPPAPDAPVVYTAPMYALIEATIEHPIEKVWPYVLNWQDFVDDHVEYRVAGSADSEGEVKLVASFDADGRLATTFFLTVVKVIPERQLVYRVLSPERQYHPVTGAVTESDITGYEVFNVRADGEHTILSLEVLANEAHPEGITLEQAQAIQDEYSKSVVRWHERFLPRLDELLRGNEPS